MDLYNVLYVIYYQRKYQYKTIPIHDLKYRLGSLSVYGKAM